MKNAPTFQFQSVRNDFMDWHFANNPTSATWIGIHDYDGELPDISGKGRKKERAHLEKVKTDLEKIDPAGLNEDDRIDRQILLDMIESSFFNMEELKSFSWNPLEYMWGLGYAYESLLAYDFAPVEERAENLSRRFIATSEYLAQAQENLVEFPKPHLETAINQAKGLAGMFDSSVPEMAEQLKDDYRKNFEHNAGLAKQAIEEFISFLERQQGNESFRDFRIGRELYNKKLYHSLKEGVTAPEVMERAEAHLRVVQNEMFELAAPLYAEWFGRKPCLDTHEDKLKIVAMHHHLIGIPDTGSDRLTVIDAGDVLRTVLDSNVNLVLCGHKHRPWIWDFNTLSIANAGTVSSERVRGFFENSYNIVNVESGTFRVDLKIVGGKRMQLRDIVKNYTQTTEN